MSSYIAKWLRNLALALLAIPLLSGCGRQGEAGKTLTVGGKNFTEQYILAELAKALLEAEGLSVNLKTGVSSPIIRKSLVNDQIDLYFEYTGTAYTVFHKQSDPEIMRDPQAVYRWVKERDAQEDLAWLEPLRFNNTYTLMLREAHAAKLGIETISDLADHVSEQPDDLVFAVGAEFWERPDGFKKLMDGYGFQPASRNIKKMSIGLTYKALKEEEVDVAMGFNTDGRIAAFNFRSLQDDKGFFPVYNPAPVVRDEALKQHPVIRAALQPLAAELSTEAMRELNKTVDIEHKSAKDVARQWLREQGLLAD